MTASSDTSPSSSTTSTTTSIGQLMYGRMQSCIYADTSDPHTLSIGLIGGDIPIFPPIAFLVSTFLSFVFGWIVTKKRLKFVPNVFSSLPIRIGIMAIGIGCAMSLTAACRTELQRVGTVPNFATVSKIANQGPFAYTRNGMYLAVLLIQFSLAIGFDTAWLLYLGVGPMMTYLDQIVVPAEERFLTRELGAEYQMYCQQVPRWLF